MAEEKEEGQEEAAAVPQKKGNLKLIIIIAAVTIVLGAGGFVGYKLMSGGDEHSAEDAVKEEAKADELSSTFPLTPFILNLTDQGRYLKVTIEFEIADEDAASLVEKKTPQLRDTIITLVSSKSIKSISSPEGKFQLKDELLFRANQVMGMEKDILKNLYFTEFVMQ